MAPKKNSEKSSSSSGYPEGLSEALNATETTDEQLATIIQNLEFLSLEEVEGVETKMKAKKEEMKQSQKLLSEKLGKVSSHKSELEKPMKDALQKERNKQAQDAKKEKSKGERERVITLVIYYKGNRYEVQIKNGKTTGKLREMLVEMFGLKKKQRLVMEHEGRDIYISGQDPNKPAFGLKRLHMLGLTNNSVINISVPTDGVPPPNAGDDPEDFLEDSEEEESDDESEAMED